MSIFTTPLPLSLYVHIPWCVRKCPYCDFNSHEMKNSLPEEIYLSALLQELDNRLPLIENRPIISIFFGGGTPSLFSPNTIERILDGVSQRIAVHSPIEITLEANPGTIDQVNFRDFYHAGINRLSLGIQSLQNDKLKTLGRIHDRKNAMQAIEIAKNAGFNNFNLDLMYGLPSQTIDDALHDMETALTFEPTHLSWYQLTIEPNTLFYRQTPILPTDDVIWEMQLAGQQLLKASGFEQYEVSAYSQPTKQCVHNLNYWQFGDYLGIGAGAHSKITHVKTGEVIRFAQVRHPKDYLDPAKRQPMNGKTIQENDLIFEFMLNALRLTHGVPVTLFTQRTGLPLQHIQPILDAAVQRKLIIDDPTHICPSETGARFLNDLTTMFL
ncbi:MAG: radical SAM family heme chaperone HemW [Gammaproteobacteria bacterium]|nr:radical SAM family heme chaperone HemW [Gammaproteobacteria bacterium]MCW5584289.1 radical SAM family heme chaperone HemW [Gammaproteobacteria bacterium]